MVPACSKATKAKIAAREKVANQVLAALGFDKTTYPLVLVSDDKGKSPDGKTTVSTDDIGKIKITRGKATKTYDTSAGADWQIAYLPDAVLVKYRDHHVITCDDDSWRLYAHAYAAP